ncbi:MAG: EAL domain-containing protein [Deltaproteobacteria bacterium]|nr:EAL domain-containing protein [Deltaproteobacteria bacterium]
MTEEAKKPEKGGAPRRYAVLIVDDERDNLDLLERALRADYEILRFTNAEDALRAVHQGQQVDLALVDHRMPSMTGIQFLARLREQEPRVMRLVLTAYADPADMIDAINKGQVYRYVMKPWNPDELKIIVRQALEHYQLERDRDMLLEQLARSNLNLQEANRRADERAHLRTQEIERMVAAMQAGPEQFASAVRGANDGLWDWDLNANVLKLSSRWKSMLGFADDELGTDPKEWFDRVHPSDLAGLQEEIQAHVKGTTPFLECEHRLTRKDGAYRWVLCRGMVVKNQSGKPSRIAGSLIDITDHGFKDRLTGLPSKTVFLDRLETTMLRAKRKPGLLFGVAAMDIKGFRLLNERHGRSFGDRLLRTVADRTKEAVRVTDTVAYLGADHFVVLLDDLADVSDALRVAGRIRALVCAPANVDGTTVDLKVNMGIAVSSSGYETAADMLIDADKARVLAREDATEQVMVFDKEVNARSVARLQLEADLRQAVSRAQLLVYLQPIISLATGKISGAEALVRWRHPERGIIPPGDFIHMAERSGMITQIDGWVLAETCRCLCELAKKNPTLPPLHVNVNVSGRQLHQKRLLEEVAATLKKTGIPGGSLTLEITETALIEDSDASFGILSQLKELGVRIALDDFGTGYSSLSYLSRFPVDILKIDRSFVSRMNSDVNTRKIVHTIITLAKSLGKAVTAEGVERVEELAALRDFHCSSAQGYLFSRPVPGDAFAELLLRDPTW